MRLDAGRDPEQHHLVALPLDGEARHALDLFEVIDDQPSDAHLERQRDLVLALVVAVKVGALGRKAAGSGRLQLATRHDVQAEALLGDEPEQPRRAVRLARVAHQ
jgi:hypothetical protein